VYRADQQSRLVAVSAATSARELCDYLALAWGLGDPSHYRLALVTHRPAASSAFTDDETSRPTAVVTDIPDSTTNLGVDVLKSVSH
jgi:hypothetical protein